VSDEILTERRGRVLVITINRPQARNAVITGAGGNFCAGMDLKAFAAGDVVAIPGPAIALTSESFTAEQGGAWGFVNVVTEPGKALPGAIELAERITTNGPMAIATTKKIIVKCADWSEQEMWKKQLEHNTRIFAFNDAKEGAIAFAEKRTPTWTGT
jgi:enoyl-CoA hydratase/carnithine racemase